jgi:hypothetical protein
MITTPHIRRRRVEALLSAVLLAAVLSGCSPSATATGADDLLFPSTVDDYAQIPAEDAYAAAQEAGATSATSGDEYLNEVGEEFTSMLDRGPDVTVDRVQFYQDPQQHLFVVVKATSPKLMRHTVQAAAASAMGLPKSETTGDVIVGNSMLVAFVGQGWVAATTHLPSDPSPIPAYRANAEKLRTSASGSP